MNCQKINKQLTKLIETIHEKNIYIHNYSKRERDIKKKVYRKKKGVT